MLKIITVLAGACLVAGCVAEGSTRLPLALNNLAITEMNATASVVEKRNVAVLACRKAGYRQKTDSYYDCMRALIARDRQRRIERTETLLYQAANRHGVCMERATYEVSRCLEI
ncbi:MAG: hypothetical protein WD470_07325 [Rhodospirillaceae bacterium]